MKRKREKCEDVEFEEESNSKKRKIEVEVLDRSKKANDFLEKAINLLKSRDKSQKVDDRVFDLLTSCLKMEPNNSRALFVRSGLHDENDPKYLELARNDLEKSLEYFEKEFTSKKMKDIDLKEEVSRLVGYEKIYNLFSCIIKFNELPRDDLLKERERFLKFITKLINLSNEYLKAGSKENSWVEDDDVVVYLKEFFHDMLLKRGATYHIKDSLNLSFDDFVVCKKYYESKNPIDAETKSQLMAVYFHLGMIFFKFSTQGPPTNIFVMNRNLKNCTLDFALEYISLFIKLHEEGVSTPEVVEISEIGVAYYIRGLIFKNKNNALVKAIKDFTKGTNYITSFDNVGLFIDLVVQRSVCVEKLKSKIFQKSSLKF